ncbi:MAG: hypothetical protein EOM91_22125 [Sphingobacteriia bacterium]|nr:hypothetical protein [Sphingobacteriia bacterium]
MSTAFLLCGWMLLCAIAGWRQSWRGRATGWLTLAFSLVTLLLSDFWSNLARSLQGHEVLPLAEPENAWLSAWMLALLPILRRRLDARAFGAMALSGLTAAAAFGLALDSQALIHAGMAATPAWSETTLLGMCPVLSGPLIHGTMALGGLVMRQLMQAVSIGWDRSLLPWDYIAWYLGLIAMHQAGSG